MGMPGDFLLGLQQLLLEREEAQLKREEAQRLEQLKREEAQRLEQYAHFESLVQRLAGSTVLSSPTVATVGQQAHSDLERVGRWHRVIEEGPPVLDEAQCRELASLEISHESVLIQWFTPHLQRVVGEACKQAEMPLCLMNTERHPWVNDPHGGAKSKPDMLVAHPALCTQNKTEGDAKYDGDGFLFGQCSHFDLRDCVTAIMEWKVQMSPGDFSGLGEGIEYARRLSHCDPCNPCVAADDVSTTQVIVADRKGFQLLTCIRGHAESCIVGEWGESGSLRALVSFLRPKPHAWLQGLESMCQKLNLSATDSSFLGRGSTGRVFMAGGHAIKVAINDGGCSMLALEHAAHDMFQQQLGKMDVTVSCTDWVICPERQFAALAVQPVGSELPMTKVAIRSALEGLLVLANADLYHGDAREPNVVWVNGKACWLDLRTLNKSTDNNASSKRDIVTFATSFGLKDQIEQFMTLTPWVLCEVPSEELLSVFAPIWRKWS